MNLTVRDVSKLLGVSEKQIHRWVKEAALPAYRVNEQYRFNRAELLEWATARRVNVSAAIFDIPEADAGPSTTLAGALERGGIFHHVGGSDTASVLRAVVERMRLPAEVDRQLLLRVLLAREALQSTGVGDGVAIPHVRNPIVLHVQEPLVTLCFLERSVDFGALDGKPVHVVFSLVSPTVRAHLRLLSRLSFALHDAGFRDAVLHHASPEEILAQARRVEATLSEPPSAQGTGAAD